MPHLDSELIRPLYDVRDGGKPKGFRCMLSICCPKDQQGCIHPHWYCERVTRTLSGMRTHQRIVHGIKVQSEFNFNTVKAITP